MIRPSYTSESPSIGELVWKLPPRDYYGLVEVVNENYHEELREYIENLFPNMNYEKMCFVVVGSDGRMERHVQSKTEIVIYTEGKLPLESYEIKQKLSDLNVHIEFGYDGRIDVKDVSRRDLPMVSVYDNPQILFPDRVINAFLILGNNNLFYKVRERAIRELVEDKKVYKVLHNQFMAHRRAFTTGLYRHLRIFDTDYNLQFYDETPNQLRFGFKAAHLRTFQRFTLMLLRSYLRTFNRSVSNIAYEFPANPIDQLYWLVNNNALRESYKYREESVTYKEVVEAYQWFMREYHRIQEEYKNKRYLIKKPFKKEEFNQWHRALKVFFYHRSK